MAHQCPTCQDVIDAGHECQPCKIKHLEARVAELEARLERAKESVELHDFFTTYDILHEPITN